MLMLSMILYRAYSLLPRLRAYYQHLATILIAGFYIFDILIASLIQGCHHVAIMLFANNSCIYLNELMVLITFHPLVQSSSISSYHYRSIRFHAS